MLSDISSTTLPYWFVLQLPSIICSGVFSSCELVRLFMACGVNVCETSGSCNGSYPFLACVPFFCLYNIIDNHTPKSPYNHLP